MRVKRTSPNATLPNRATNGSVGYDLYASSSATIKPNGGRALIPTNLIILIPEGHYGRIAPRSGLTLKFGINVGAGVIDPDYRGEVGVILFNHGMENFEVKQGDKIAQLILERASYDLPVIEVERIEEDTERGKGGFGSTDIKSPGGPPFLNTKKAKTSESAWNERLETGAQLCAICNVCGGSSISTCACAKKRFMENY
jgi:dUTP pyrophosphatase